MGVVDVDAGEQVLGGGRHGVYRFAGVRTMRSLSL